MPGWRIDPTVVGKALPTFVGRTGLPDASRPQAIEALASRDFSTLLADPEKASLTAVQPAVLFNYVGPSTVDADFFGANMERLISTGPSLRCPRRSWTNVAFSRSCSTDATSLAVPTRQPLSRRDGRCRRYSGTMTFQLFDLPVDPEEMRNLALEPEKNGATILRMNELLNDLIAKEVGVNGGRFLSQIIGRP